MSLPAISALMCARVAGRSRIANDETSRVGLLQGSRLSRNASGPAPFLIDSQSPRQRSLVQPIPCAFEESQNPLFSRPIACQQTVAVKMYIASEQRFLRLEQLSSLRERVEPGPHWCEFRAPSSQ